MEPTRTNDDLERRQTKEMMTSEGEMRWNQPARERMTLERKAK